MRKLTPREGESRCKETGETQNTHGDKQADRKRKEKKADRDRPRERRKDRQGRKERGREPGHGEDKARGQDSWVLGEGRPRMGTLGYSLP